MQDVELGQVIYLKSSVTCQISRNRISFPYSRCARGDPPLSCYYGRRAHGEMHHYICTKAAACLH